MKKTFICKAIDCAIDWHDWEQEILFLGTKENKYEINPKNIVDIILTDISENHATIPDDKYEEFKETLIYGSLGTTISFQYVAGTSTYPDGSVEDIYDTLSITKNNQNFKVSNNSQYELDIWYQITEIEEDDIIYLPVREFIMAPKYSPMVEQAETEYFTDFDEAVKYLDNMQDLPKEKIMPFLIEKRTLLIDSKRSIDENDWYIMNTKLLDIINNKEHEFYSPSNSWIVEKIKEA